MSKNLRASQGGAIRTYIIVGVALAVALLLSLYFVQQRGEQVRQEQALAQADELNGGESSPPITEEPSTPEDSEPTPEPNEDATPEPEPATEIPQTGASDLITPLVAAIYAGVVAAYLKSRRAVL